ncbi:MAG TPA: twin-arginine translocation pathway signal protein [Gammaproteobacteria bacterium]|nr:twin-arginine translocation pathway signal protein [Gammaproteobacteria bacterium]
MKDHGINKPITRRDFVGGVAVAISGSVASRWSEAGAPVVSYEHLDAKGNRYPPVRTGMRGSHDGSFDVAHKMRDGIRWNNSVETEEQYDLIVVGGGLSGLATAWYFKERDPAARILILDNHDDFGGHAKRNEFWHGDRMLLCNGGTLNISNLHRYDEEGQRLLKALGIDVERYSDFHDGDLYISHGLGRGVFFDRETFGEDRLVVGEGEQSWPQFLAQTPLSAQARQDLARLYDDSGKDYLGHLSQEEKVKFLQNTSYEDFLLEKAKIGREAVSFLWRSTTWAIGIDAISGWVAATSGWPGTSGLGVNEYSGDALFCQFPDGNATIARLLVRSLIPSVAAGNTLDDVVEARFDYSALDVPESAVRVRLDSTVVKVKHCGDPVTSDQVEVDYVRGDRAYRVRGGSCVLACYHSAIPYLCDELPAAQKEALSSALKAPLIYTSVLLRNWRAFSRLGIRNLRSPGSYFESMSLQPALSIGGYRHSSGPDEPIVLRMSRAPLDLQTRGLPASEQWKEGRTELLTTTFETFELKIRDQLDRILSDGGFESARDIEAITVNRWPHGYAYGQDPETGQVAWNLDELSPERSPWLEASKPFGRIAIANSDARADAMTEGAFKAAHMAVAALVSD